MMARGHFSELRTISPRWF